jgi:hypothetical protein
MKPAEVTFPAGDGETATRRPPQNPHHSESGGPMKMQWILAALLVAVVVFIATYLKMNMGATTKPEEKADTAQQVTLFFPKTASRSDDDKNPAGAEWESGVPGHYDFWFQNANDESVTVGVDRVGCVRCTKVEIALETNEWKTWEATLTLNLMFRTRGSLDLVGPSLTSGNEWALPEPTRDWQDLMARESGVEVPARASGWIRVDWDAHKLGPEQFTARIWTHAKDSTAPHTDLLVRVLLVPAIRVQPSEVDVQVISEDQPQTKPELINCWSSTRDTFAIEMTKDSSPFVVCGPPQWASADQLAAASHVARVKCGCQIPISVRERLEGGRQLDLGPFQLKVFFKADVAAEPVEVKIKGVVKGEVSVVGTERPDQIVMGDRGGYFEAAYGDVKEATLETRNLSLKLAVDKVPSFLKVELATKPKSTDGVKRWSIRVEVPKRAVAGEFPRDDHPDYRDSAIYLKILDAKSQSEQVRRIRIPVSGKASIR